MFGDQWGNTGILHNRGNNMPVVNDEYGYIDYINPLGAYSLSGGLRFSESRTTLRNVIWGIAMAGGYGSFGGDDTTEAGTQSSPIFSADWIDQPEVYGDIRVFSDFMQSVPYWQMAPQGSWVSGNRVYAFGGGTNHVIYVAAGSTFTVNLPSGDTCSLARLDPRTGVATSLGAISSGATSLSTPDAQDYAYQLTGSSCN
jgi:hypothetical protein